MQRWLGTLIVIVSVSFAVVVCADQKPAVEFLNSGKVMPTDLPFSEAVRVDNILYLSGQLGIMPGTRTLAEGGIEAEAKQAMQNIQTSLVAHGLSLSDVVKCTVMMADIAEWATFNTVYQSFFEAPYPARSAFGTSGLGARVEVECVAAIPQ
jgi:2-iminobutanoate/2-iminopropanoate deaminase